MMYWRWILLPFSWLFYGITRLRNFFYDKGFFPAESYPQALICIGNIRVGGTGKTPFTEFLIRSIQSKYSVAILSRGYGRKTKGFLEVEAPNAILYGDEPSQYKARFPEIKVYVSGDRKLALDSMANKHQVILLDDAFQHRRIKAGLNWVLIEYNDLKSPIHVFPAGNYREGIIGLKRAQNILITKCNGDIEPGEIERIRNRLNLEPYQGLYFSSIQYLPIKRVIPKGNRSLDMELNIQARNFNHILAFTGIANYKPLEVFLRSLGAEVSIIPFRDHHIFTLRDIQNIQRQFEMIKSPSKILLTTEKDLQRLGQKDFESFIREYPVYFQPIQFQIQNGESDAVKDLILKYVESTL